MPKIIVAMCISITLLVTTACVPSDLYLPELKANEGFLIVSLNANNEEVTEDHRGWSTLVIRKVSKQNKISRDKIFLRTIGGEHQNSFYKTLPEGRYIISGLHAQEFINDYPSIFHTYLLSSRIEFTIEKNKILNLGSITFHPTTPATIFSRGGKLRYKDNYSPLPGSAFQKKKDNNYILKELIIKDKSKSKVAEKIFNMETVNHAHIVDSNNDVIRPGLRKSFKTLANGAAVAYGKLGSWSILHGDKWAHYKLRSDDEITDITLFNDTYLITTNSGEIHQSLASDIGLSQAKFIRQIDNAKKIIHVNGQLYIVTKSNRGVIAYSATSINSDLLEIQRIDMNIFDGVTEAFSVNISAENELIIHAYGNRYSLKKSVWEKTSSYDLAHISKNSGNGIYTATTYTGNYHFSTDDGKSWNPFYESTHYKFIQPKKYPPILLEDGNSFLIASAQYSLSDLDSHTRNQMTYQDLRLININTGSKPAVKKVLQSSQSERCYGLIPEISTQAKIFMLCNVDTLKFSTDLGRTWEVDPTFSLIDKPKVNDTAVLAM